MKHINACLLLAFAAVAGTTAEASAFDLKNLMSGSEASDMVGNLIEGVFTTSNLEVRDLAGVWTTSGSAVSFQSENFLNKAGGVAAASAIEAKLNPYYKKYGLTGAVITIQVDGSFTMKVKKVTLSGNITKSGNGTFNFNFTAAGKIRLGSVKTYVQKSSGNMDIMFDVTKLKSILSAVAGIGGSTLKTVSSLLESYDGLCVGFAASKTGRVPGEDTTPTAGDAVNGLMNIFKK